MQGAATKFGNGKTLIRGILKSKRQLLTIGWKMEFKKKKEFRKSIRKAVTEVSKTDGLVIN